MTTPIVQVKNLNKTIKGKHIIKSVNLDFYAGQITGFLGPNGAGKTTTIRMMTGLMYPTSGEVIINGKSLQQNFEQAISHVGVIVENPEMYKYMSGYKNLQHFARMHNVPKSRIDEVVEQVGLQNRIHEKVKTYSLGMRQRLGLAQAMLHRPKFLILDEPTNGLDPAGIREFRMYLRRIAEEDNVAIVVSSHLLSEIELMVDRIAVIQNGEIIDIRELKEETVSEYYIEVGQKEQFASFAGENAKPQNEGFVVTITKEDVPKFVRRMVEAGIDVYTIQPITKRLEDQFIELTGGGAIDAVR
ncbi:bacitracin ABC transporter ATP-binding protein [Ureibacillus massiliensis 4400831 = CIP 108448 = CCUG 49529]|uniref:Bacitracin ABC transporter ATP-binding protein n=1 Tax=Ureibacillus massiliensis 4400831 = CIP 108448 = CCUG 49529 TaxID=1211035 RepID=A0A0A3J756_9BACL|nr:ABC transporter ATP-binding protein [Ureibacillus massiliensis]KGR91580.1 bacitracin ABC transporter ATP-binding protein [Ureibacillus massiliensis 4400831 = CIP 108448 = CCUG 49529]